MSNSFYHERYCLTKEQEEIIRSLLPAPKSTGRPCLNPLTVFNAILWILSSGASWRDLSTHSVNRNSIYHKFRQWCSLNLFDNILKALVVDTDKYQHAAGARKILGNQAIGVSRDGKTTKIHALVTENFQLIRLLLTGGQIHDSECAIELLSKVKKHDFDCELYKVRNIIERFFLRIKNHRHIATRYDKLLTCFENFVLLAAIMIQI